MDLTDYSFPNQVPTWCPGCGNFAVLSAVKESLVRLNIAPKDTVVTYDIGCGGNMVNFLRVCGFATLHGRSIPVAVGAKKANPNLTVIAQGGDGGLLNEGTNHLVHAAQRNDNITVLLFNNLVFALTTGQMSSATPLGMRTKSTPEGNPYKPLNALLLAASSGDGFLARVFAFDVDKMTTIVKEALAYPGFSLVEIVMPCLAWGGNYNVSYFQDRIFYQKKPFKNKQKLVNFLVKGKKDKLPLGIFWR